MKLEDFKNKHDGKLAFIVGKGPSLDTLEQMRDTINHESAVVFCLNESIHKVEELKLSTPVYVVQQDSRLESRCVPKNPEIVHFMSAWQYTKEKPIAKRYDVSPYNQNAVLYWHEIANERDQSAVAALKIAKLMGMNRVCFLCFDSWANGWQGDHKYAGCIKETGFEPGPHGIHGCWITTVAKELMKEVEVRHPSVSLQ